MADDKEYMLDIVEAARLAIGYIEGKSQEDFFDDYQCQDAVIRRLEIIGEASRRVSEQTRDKFPNLPWSDMIGMRNIMIHEYDDVDMYIVWETVNNDLPVLIHLIDEILKSWK